MPLNKQQLQGFFTQPYQREAWLHTLHAVLPRTELFAMPHPLAVPETRVNSVLQLGRVRLGDDRHLGIVEATVDGNLDLARNRVGLRNVVTRFIDQAEYHGMLATFRGADSTAYRFTFTARESALDETGQLIKRETAPRRYTYLLGPTESCRTPAERFEVLALKGDGAQLSDVIDAFSVEKLNKEFFADFCKAFERLAGDIRKRNESISRDDAVQEAQTILNRMLFLCFIQRKGWLNRRRDFLHAAFREHSRKNPDGTTFYTQFLHKLFIKLSSEDAYFETLGDLPFLNGGLFADELASQSPEMLRRIRMKIGNGVFEHVFNDLLLAYNFTVHEDSPLSVEVAVDPEMLGKVFESLVLQLEQSDTGGKTSRHDTGSYYTPRPIVHYLCREGLRGWLEQFPPNPKQAKDWPARVEELLALDASDGIDPGERAILDDCLTPEEARALLDRLDTLRACDPAVGSGAFPVGLLHELVNLHRLCDTRSRGKDPVETDHDWLYDTKGRIIQRVLYGVDIQNRAVEICKLRLWLSLMVDYDLGVDVDNCSQSAFRTALKKIPALPNLDYKIRRANSLIDMVRGHPVNIGGVKIDDPPRSRPPLVTRLVASHDMLHWSISSKSLRAQSLTFDIFRFPTRSLPLVRRAFVSWCLGGEGHLTFVQFVYLLLRLFDGRPHLPGQLPNPHAAVRAGAGGVVTVGTHGDARHRPLMPGKRANFLPGVQLPDLDRFVFTRTDRKASVARERHAPHRLGVAVKLMDFAPIREIPELHGFVPAATQPKSAIGTERHAGHLRQSVVERAHLLPLGHVP